LALDVTLWPFEPERLTENEIESFQGLESLGAREVPSGRSLRSLDQSRVLRASESFTSACQCIRTPGFTGITIESDSEDAEEAGDIRAALERAGTPIGPHDILIAAQARRRSAVLITANEREFVRVPGLKTEDWASPA
jgi:PIN domain